MTHILVLLEWWKNQKLSRSSKASVAIFYLAPGPRTSEAGVTMQWVFNHTISMELILGLEQKLTTKKELLERQNCGILIKPSSAKRVSIADNM